MHFWIMRWPWACRGKGQNVMVCMWNGPLGFMCLNIWFSDGEVVLRGCGTFRIWGLTQGTGSWESSPWGFTARAHFLFALTSWSGKVQRVRATILVPRSSWCCAFPIKLDCMNHYQLWVRINPSSTNLGFFGIWYIIARWEVTDISLWSLLSKTLSQDKAWTFV